MTQDELIKHCFDVHVSDCNGEIKFTFEQYSDFWKNNAIGSKYEMRNRDGSIVTDISIVYYPLPHPTLTALVGIPMKNNATDYREIPVHFLKKIKF
jgi:hypothetical protein